MEPAVSQSIFGNALTADRLDLLHSLATNATAVKMRFSRTRFFFGRSVLTEGPGRLPESGRGRIPNVS